MKLEAAWQRFRDLDIAPDAPPVQLTEMRKAFYSGAASAAKIAAFSVMDECEAFSVAETARRKAAAASKRRS